MLTIVNAETEWQSAATIAVHANLTYEQTVFALLALHNTAKIARRGSKSTSKWGPLSLLPVTEDSYALLQSLFNGSIKR